MASVFRTFLEKLGGTTAAQFVGTKGDLFFDPDQGTPTLKVSDGSTPGGVAVGGSGGGLNNLVEDTTPQLGGPLDWNNQKFTNHILPSANDTYDIGSAEFKIRDLYVADNTIYMGDNATIKADGTAVVVKDLKTGDLHLDNTHRDGNSVDGTSGSWTFEEGDENLFLLNNITGKKYKINLTEVT